MLAGIFGVEEIVVLVLVLVGTVLFGSTKIPELARALGSTQKEFKERLHEGGTDTSTAAAGS